MAPEIWTAVVNMKQSHNILVVNLLKDPLYDESGVMCYTYGNMGEVTEETRIYALPFLSQPIALSTQFEYDSWGRIQSITYPDNEVVSYTYDLGGQLQSVSNNSSYTYLDNVAYDRFGAKVSQTYGNGLVTDYTYNNTTRRLSQITVTDNSNNPYSDIQYTYDPVGNVTQVASSYSWTQGQAFTETFTYDASDQLTSAAETQAQSYQLEVGYGDWGRIDDYSLLQTELWSGATTHDHRSFAYPNDPYNLQQVQTLFAPETHNGTSDAQYTFGINGSLRKLETHAPNHNVEYYLFNSSANLKAYSYDGLDFAYYGYNAANTRTYKLSMLNMNQWVNGQPQPLNLQLQSAMFYPNAYLNFNQNGEYTKHYYNGTERIASRLGDVNLSMAFDYDDMLETHRAQIEERFRVDMQALFNEEVPVDNPPMLDVSSLQPTGTPNDIFYYHMNHLGSTAFATDQNQNITQGFLYAPFGEITTEYNANFYSNVLPKYSFNAKELDEETGMYYYEARYYAPPVFTSRDPMMDQKPWLTPYHSCSNNPVGRLDPSGMLDDEWEYNMGTQRWTWRSSKGRDIGVDIVHVTSGNGNSMGSYVCENGLSSCNCYGNVTNYMGFHMESFRIIDGNNSASFTYSISATPLNENTTSDSKWMNCIGEVALGTSIETTMIEEAAKSASNVSKAAKEVEAEKVFSKVSKLAKWVGRASTVVGIVGDGYDLYNATTTSGMWHAGINITMDIIGFIPPFGTAASIAWGLFDLSYGDRIFKE